MRQHTSNAPTHTHANTHTHTRTILSGTKKRYDNIKHQTQMLCCLEYYIPMLTTENLNNSSHWQAK